MNCYRITPDDKDWSAATTDGVFERELFSSHIVRLREFRSSGPTALKAERALYLLSAGELKKTGGRSLVRGDLYWCNAKDESLLFGSNGATVYCIEPMQGLGRELLSREIASDCIPWENFADPAGRPTQPVQVLLDGTVSVLRTRFDPSYIAGEHWHDFDTLYFISEGRMQFGDEGWFEQGEIRAVHGGHSYGPERPGAAGVEFVLVSIGGPVALHWSDLEKPPS